VPEIVKVPDVPADRGEPVTCVVDYGFIPETLSVDGDALDVLVCVSEPTFPGCVVLARPIALDAAALLEIEESRRRYREDISTKSTPMERNAPC
jgi:inorganic pyrophosphatase